MGKSSGVLGGTDKEVIWRRSDSLAKAKTT